MRCTARSGASPAEQEYGPEDMARAPGSHGHREPTFICVDRKEATPRALPKACRGLAGAARVRGLPASDVPPALARRASKRGSESLAAESARQRRRLRGRCAGALGGLRLEVDYRCAERAA